MADQFITDLSKLDKATQDILAKNGQGMTAAEYLAARGGVNPVTHKYGDSYNPNVDLTDAEYQAAIAGAGSKIGDKGSAINAATKAKIEAYIKSHPDAGAAEVQKAIMYGVLKSPEYTIDSQGNIIGVAPESTSKKTVSSVVKQSDGSSIVTYSDGSTITMPAGSAVPAVGSLVTGTSSGSYTTAAADRQSAYDLLYNQFKQYGLESLVEGIKGLIQSNVSPSEFAIRLQDTDAYKKRFAANQERINKGLQALTPAEYIGLEDQYQNIMRNYGLPSSYYSKDSMGTQVGFNKFIANDVSAAELEDRIATAQKRVLNADVNVMDALKQFYPDITNADILAYTLDPTNALENIKRKVTAAEIGGAALSQGLGTNVNRAEELAKYGITKAQAQQGYGTIGEFLPTAEKLGDIYSKQGLGAYDQATAESEVFGTQGGAQAAQKRKKLAQLEQATFGGQAGTSQGALDRGRQGSF